MRKENRFEELWTKKVNLNTPEAKTYTNKRKGEHDTHNFCIM